MRPYRIYGLIYCFPVIAESTDCLLVKPEYNGRIYEQGFMDL